MRMFYGGIFISKVKLEEANIYNPIKLEYYKIKNEEKNKEEYGIEIIKTEYRREKVLIENIKFEKITNNEDTANKILEILKRNEVTPISANDIMEDLAYLKNSELEKVGSEK